MHLRLRARSPILLGILLLCAHAHAGAATWRIRADGSGDAPTIQAAIDGAANGDSVTVAPGDYTVHLWIEGKGIVLRSEQGPSATILHGVPTQDDLAVIAVFFDEGKPSTIEGFTIRDGSPGIRLTSASPTIRGNVIVHNQSSLGAGICCNFSSNAIIEGNLIARNRTWFHCCLASRGGGIYADDTSAATIRDNVVAYNRCEGECIGGGISVFIGTIEGNTVVGNHADGPAGGIELPYVGAEVSRNIVFGNDSAEFGDGIVVFREAELFCNDVYGNGDENYWGTEPGAGDFLANPRFCGLPRIDAPISLQLEDFDLRSDSPCLPGQHPQGVDCGRIGARSAGCETAPVPVRAPGDRRIPPILASPNPTRGRADIHFRPTPAAAGDFVEVVSAGGRLVARIAASSPGLARWDGLDESGRSVAAGLYYVRIPSGSIPQQGTILVIR